jgi:hypothetical protein
MIHSGRYHCCAVLMTALLSNSSSSGNTTSAGKEMIRKKFIETYIGGISHNTSGIEVFIYVNIYIFMFIPVYMHIIFIYGDFYSTYV